MHQLSLPAIHVEDLLPQRRSLRVSVVSETYPHEVNGLAATIARIVEDLRVRGHELQLVRPRQHAGDGAPGAPPACSGSLTEVLRPGLPIPRYPDLKMGLPSKRALVHLWTQRRPDVVHLVTEGPLGWSALAAARTLRLPEVSNFRTNFHAYSQHYGTAWLRNPLMRYLRRFHNHGHCTMVLTEALRREMAKPGFERLRVVSRGVDTRLFDPARHSLDLRQSWGADARSVVVLCVGRLAPEKNLAALERCWTAMSAKQDRLKLVLVGDGPLRATLQQRLPHAVFAGLQHGTDLAAHYACADLFLFLSLTETVGNVVPEAMASGLTVVAYDCAAAAQLIRSGENGWLAKPEDEGALQLQACRAVADPDQLRVVGRRARIVSQRLDWESVVALVEAEYEAAMHASTCAQ